MFVSVSQCHVLLCLERCLEIKQSVHFHVRCDLSSVAGGISEFSVMEEFSQYAFSLWTCDTVTCKPH